MVVHEAPREMLTHEKSHGDARENLMVMHEIFHERVSFDVSWALMKRDGAP